MPKVECIGVAGEDCDPKCPLYRSLLETHQLVERNRDLEAKLSSQPNHIQVVLRQRITDNNDVIRLKGLGVTHSKQRCLRLTRLQRS